MTDHSFYKRVPVVRLCSVLQLIPQFSAESDESSGVPIQLPVRAGLAVLQVRQRFTFYTVLSLLRILYLYNQDKSHDCDCCTNRRV